MTRNYVWIVEMLDDGYSSVPPRWMPTEGCGLTKKGAVECRKDFERGNPNDKFRVTMYLATREP